MKTSHGRAFDHNNKEERDQQRLTALIGGSFDPIHNGHLHLARELLKDPLISVVAFLPVGRHHFKGDRAVLSYSNRAALIARVLEPSMELWEDDASGNGFTADLIRRLRIRYPEKRFAFVIGSDNLSQLPLWREYEWLRENLFFIVIPRPGYDLRMPEPAPRCQIKAIDAPDISSSQIRALIASGQPLTGLLPQCIEEDVVKLYTQGEQHP